MTVLRGAAVTDVGRVRSVNQDGALTSAFLVAVADGMGGHRAGEVASAVALRSLAGHDHFASVDEVVTAVRRANASIYRRATGDPELRGMGTTLCALALVGGEDEHRGVSGDGGGERLAVVNVGDSRAYHLRDGDLEQLTIDHSLVQMMVREGKLRPEDAANHPQRNIVLRALGIDPDVEVDHWELEPVVGDRFLVCSDGLFNEVSEGRMAATLRAYADPAEAAKVLVGLANAAGGRDNVTCVVVDVVADSGSGDSGGSGGSGDDAADRAADPATGGARVPAAGAAARPSGPDGPGEPSSARSSGGDASAAGALRARRVGGGTTVLASAPALDDDPALDLDDDLLFDTDADAHTGAPRAGRGRRRRGGERAPRPRRITLRVLGFLLLIVIVFGVAVLAVGWYATRTYFVSFDGDQVVIYQGRPGGLLWIEPTVKERTSPPLDRAALVGVLCDRVASEPSATSLGGAREIVEQVRRDAAQLRAPLSPCGGAG